MEEVRLSLENKIEYSLYGMLLFLIIFMSIQYLQNQRKPFYLYFSLFTFSILLSLDPPFISIHDEFTHLVEWPAVLLYFLFLNALLNLAHYSRPFASFLRYFKRGFVIAMIVQTSLVLLIEKGELQVLESLPHTIDDLFFYFAYAASAYTIIEVLRLKNTLSRYLVIGMLFLTVGVVLNQLFRNELRTFPIWIGVFVDLLVFASAIGYKTWLTEKEKGEAQKEMLKATLTTLKDQMNPHFISNCLNSIKLLIQKGQREQAIEYLTKFAKLYRLIVANFRSQKISLDKELSICQHYLEMEKLRFKASFNYQINVMADQDIVSFVEIPPLLLQPFLENAIWHGLLPKEGKKHLHLLIESLDTGLRCIIDDNGVGWKEKLTPTTSDQSATHKRSTGIENAREKLKIFRALYDVSITLNILDKKDPAGKPLGVRVEFLIDVD